MAVQTLKCVFTMPGDKTYTLSLADPKVGLTKAECRTFMNEVVAEEAITVADAAVNGIKEMYIHTVDDVELAD